MGAKLTDGWVDYSEDHHLFVGKFISKEAQCDHAYKLVNSGKEGNVYVHYHKHLEKCVVEKCTKYSMSEHDVAFEPVFTSEITENEVAD